MRRAIVITLLLCWVPETTPKPVCKYHDVAEHLNISSNRELFLYTIPKRNWEGALDVGLDFTLVSILSVEEKLQVVTFYFWLYVIWTNEFISWDPSDFCNISSVSLPANLFWTPDIYIDERADEDKFTASPFVNISSNGSIVAFQAHRLTSSCNLDVHAFPFDKQACNLTIMSSAYSDEDILMKSIKTSKMANQDSHKNYLTNGEWKFEQLRIVEHVMSYDTFSTSTVIYEITMTRRSILQVLVLILPTFSLFLLDMAISYAFASPGEKIVFKVTLILEVSFLSMILNDKLPTTSDNPPVIAKFFTGLFMFMVLGILENAFILYLREAKPTFQCFRGKKFLNKFKRTKERKSEDPTTCFGSEMRREDTPLPENEHSDSLVFLKHLNAELKQIKKHLALEEVQNDAPKYSSQDKSFLQVEKTLYFARLILSLVFLTYIVIIWRH